MRGKEFYNLWAASHTKIGVKKESREIRRKKDNSKETRGCNTKVQESISEKMCFKQW